MPGLGLGLDVDVLAAIGLAVFEHHGAVYQCEEGVVFADTNVVAWVEPRAALAHDDISSQGILATKKLDA